MKQLLLCVLLATGNAPSVMVCDCLMTPVEDHFASTKYIITGAVTDLLDSEQEQAYQLVKNPNLAYRVKVNVTAGYKGALAKGQTIEIASDFSNCSFVFGRQASYLLFLEEQNGKYYVRSCSYSARSDVAQVTLEKLNKWLTQNPKQK